MIRYSDEIIEEVRQNNDIVDIISQYVHLTRKGRNYFGLCPFHSEKSPSFSVSPDRQIFHCFGCGVGGNVYTFLMKIEGITFKEALEQLVENATKAVKTTAGGSGIGTMGKVAIGVATGLMVGGYASGNPLNDKSAQQVSDENQAPPIETMSIPDFMDKQGGYVTGNSQQGYIINIKADTKKGRKHMEKIMARAAEATVGGAVSVNMNIKNVNNNGGITDKDIENYMNRFI